MIIHKYEHESTGYNFNSKNEEEILSNLKKYLDEISLKKISNWNILIQVNSEEVNDVKN